MNGNFRNFAIWLVILFMLMGLFQVFQSTGRSVLITERTYSQFISDVDAGIVATVTIADNKISGLMLDNTQFETTIPAGTNIVDRLQTVLKLLPRHRNQARSGQFYFLHGCRFWLLLGFGFSLFARCRAAVAAVRWVLASQRPR